MESLTFPIFASIAIALWTVANCVGIWARNLDSRVKVLTIQRRMQENLAHGARSNTAPTAEGFDVDIVPEENEVDILPEEPPLQQAA